MAKFKLVSPGNFLVTVVGVGGCGCNAISMLSDLGVSQHASLVAINTDNAALSHCSSDESVLIGESLTNGYGAGADPAVGLEAARESREAIIQSLGECDFVILIAGLGGGTGTGATPFVSSLINEMGKPCITVATLPFESEGEMRMGYALKGLEELRATGGSLITLPNENLISALGESVGLFSAFKHSNEMLQRTVRSLVGLLTESGMINVDFNDFKNVMGHYGDAIIGVGRSATEEGAVDALNTALNNPLASNADLKGAKGIILQINCSEEITMATYNALTSRVRDSSNKKALILCGVALMPEMEERIEVLVIATGIHHAESDMEITTKEQQYLGDEAILDIPTFLRNQKAI